MNLDSSGRALPRQYNYQRVNQEYNRHTTKINGHYMKNSVYGNGLHQIFGKQLKSCFLVIGVITLVLVVLGLGIIAGLIDRGELKNNSAGLKIDVYEGIFDGLFSEKINRNPRDISGKGELDVEHSKDRIQENDKLNNDASRENTFTNSFQNKVSQLLKGRHIQNGGMSSGLPPVTLHFDQNGNLIGNSVKVGNSNGVNVEVRDATMHNDVKDTSVKEGQRLRGSRKEESTTSPIKDNNSVVVNSNQESHLSDNKNINYVDKDSIVSTTEKVTESSIGNSAVTGTPSQAMNYADGLVDTPILIISHDRDDYLKRTLKAIKQYHPSNDPSFRGKGLIPIVISEDGEHVKMKNVIDMFRKEIQLLDPSIMVYHINHKQDISLKREPDGFGGYRMLSQHFKWALNRVFHTNYQGKAFTNSHQQEMATMSEIEFNELSPLLPFRAKSVIILEEDLEISPDFFVYFGSFMPLLYSEDANLLTISAWNDNGIKGRVKNEPGQFYRSDFFPGLGWVLTSKLWDELGPQWPRGFWDDWMREPPQRQARQIIRPDLSRTLHFGDIGTSSGQHRSVWKSMFPATNSAAELQQIINTMWNQKDVQVHKEVDGSTLSILGNDLLYHEYIQNEVSNAEEKDIEFIKSIFLENRNNELDLEKYAGKAYKIYYDGHQGPHGFEKIANALSIMSDEKAMVPRTAYEGVVTIWLNNARTKLMITPRKPTKNYKD